MSTILWFLLTIILNISCWAGIYWLFDATHPWSYAGLTAAGTLLIQLIVPRVLARCLNISIEEFYP